MPYDDATDSGSVDEPLEQPVAPAPQDTTPGKPQGDVQVAAQIPERPAVDTTVSTFVRDLWNETNNLPAFDEAVKAAREAQKTLFPAWHDKGDKWLGRVPTEARTRKEDRLVRTPHIYLNQRHAIAQTVPEDHAAMWEPREQVKRRDSEEIAASSDEELWADTVRVATKEYLAEARLQEWLEAFVQDCKTFPLGCLKMTFQRDWTSDALNGTAQSNDEEDSVQRLRVLAEEMARGNLTKQDPRYLELHQLAMSLGGKTELQVWRRLRLSTVPINAFRAPESCKDPLTIYDQPWLADDSEMTPEEIRAKFPFRQKPNADGTPGEWTGVHPEDLDIATGASSPDGTRVNTSLKRRSTRRGNRVTASEVKPTLTVREVWHRMTNTVYVLVDGIQYPVAKWVPERQHDKWYPYIVVVPNRIPNDLYGISDVELQADIQHRMNRKHTDEEKARWLALPRDYFDTSAGDEAKLAAAINEAKPGKAVGLPLGGRPIGEFLQRTSWEFPRDAFDTSRDDEHLRKAGRIPEQAQGVTGKAKFAEEVKVADQGNSLATGYDQNLYKRAIADVYDRAAQHLIFELDEDDWKEVAGPNALIPELATEEEARAKREEIRKEAKQQAVADVMGMLGQDPTLMTPWGQPDPEAMKRRAAQLAGKYEEQLCANRYGPAGLISREGLYRRLRVKVVLSLNGSVDRERRMNALNMMMQSLLAAAEAAERSGLALDPKPWLRRWADLSGEHQALDAMFSQDPNSLGEKLVNLLARGMQLSPDTLAMLGKVLGPQMAQQAMVEAKGGGAVPGALPEPEKPAEGAPAGAAA